MIYGIWQYARPDDATIWVADDGMETAAANPIATLIRASEEIKCEESRMKVIENVRALGDKLSAICKEAVEDMELTWTSYAEDDPVGAWRFREWEYLVDKMCEHLEEAISWGRDPIEIGIDKTYSLMCGEEE